MQSQIDSVMTVDRLSVVEGFPVLLDEEADDIKP
jgi:hypothetical protein